MNDGPQALPGAWRAVALLWPVALLNYLDRQVLSTLQPAIGADIAEVIDSRNFGRLMGLFLWVYGLASPWSGMLADRLSRKWLVTGSLAVWSLVTVWTGSAGSFAELQVSRGLMGISEALYIPAALALIADLHPGRTRSLAVGVHMTGLYVGQALGGFGALAAEHLSWRGAFHWLGVLGLIHGVVLAVWLREIPRRGGSPPADGSAVPAGPSAQGAGRLLGCAAFWVLLWYFAAPSAPGWAMKNWLPTVFAKIDPAAIRAWIPWAGHWSDAELAARVAKPVSTVVIAVSSFVGVLSGGLLADRWAARNLRGRIFTGVIGLTLTLPALWLLGHGGGLAPAVTAAVLYGVGFGWFDANNMPVLCQFVPPRLRAAGYGCLNLAGVSSGALATQVLGSWDKQGRLAEGISWLALPVAAAIALVLLLRPKSLNCNE